ncbi:DUF3419 family protein [Salinimicrobium soli]|uniref:DUF3419 family protein n=1 Tax=Salinimicrobium soli TaxID=1254399 RepID=UPI003AAE0C0B
MESLFDFGISQDDPLLEVKTLSLSNSNLLCLASAGEVPLSLIALENVTVTAVDMSLNQIRLCNLKLAAVMKLQPEEAAEFLGFNRSSPQQRKIFFHQLIPGLLKEDVEFWKENFKHIEHGIVWSGKFEKYIRFFCRFATIVMGRKRILKFMELDDPKEQQTYFDRYLDKAVLKWLFKIAFSPQLYKGRGLNPKGLLNERKDMAGFFYSRFRDFFTRTPARKNFYLQFYMLGEIPFKQAYPQYLHRDTYEHLRSQAHKLRLVKSSIQEEIGESKELNFENLSLSNLSDWLEEKEMDGLIEKIVSKNACDSNWLFRYIHKDPLTQKASGNFRKIEPELNKKYRELCRFPFYSGIGAKAKAYGL